MRFRAFLTALAGAAALAAATLAPAAAPAVRVAPLQIAFNSSDESSLSIGTTAGNDGQVVYQSDGTTSVTALSIAPDGSNVLVVDDTDQDQLALVPVAGGDPALIDGTIGADSGAFSPDGKSIVFSIGQNTSDTLAPGIYSVAVSGGTPTQLVASPDGAIDSCPALSPDGTQLAFVRDAIAADGTETVTLEVTPVAGGAATELADSLVPTLEGGQRLSFSPDGKTIAYVGDASQNAQGIFTAPVAGGQTAQLTSDSDYWPIFSPDGSTLFFSRDAFSANADDNAESPVDPIDNDLDELWSMNADGSGVAVIAEGEFVSLAAAPLVAKASGGGTGGGGGGGGGGSTGGSGGGTGGGTGGGGTKPKPVSATGVHVAVHGTHYVVTWKGKASAWKVQLKVGKLTASAKVRGSVHTHTFTLRGAKGIPRATVKSSA